MTPPFLLQLSDAPFGLRCTIEADVLRQALANLPEGANAVSFLQTLDRQSAQALIVWLLSMPGVGGPLAPDLVADYLRGMALLQPTQETTH